MIRVPITHVTLAGMNKPVEVKREKSEFMFDEPMGGVYEGIIQTLLALGCSFVFTNAARGDVELRIEYKDTLVASVTSTNNRKIYSNFINLLNTYTHEEVIRVLRTIEDITRKETDE